MCETFIVYISIFIRQNMRKKQTNRNSYKIIDTYEQKPDFVTVGVGIQGTLVNHHCLSKLSRYIMSMILDYTLFS